MRSRCHAEGLPPLPSLKDLNSVVQPNGIATVADAAPSGTTNRISESVDAIADAVNSAGVDSAAASIPVEYLALGALGLGTRIMTTPTLVSQLPRSSQC